MAQSHSYYSGHGTGMMSWGPIMGAAFSRNLDQFSMNTYPGANNPQDDLQVITTGNGFTYRPDDYGDSTGAAHALNAAFESTLTTTYGLIERNTDSDYFTFVANPGPVNITIDALFVGPNLDISAELLDSTGTVLDTSNPLADIDASFTTPLTTGGTYYIRVSGTGLAGPTGYTNYGSLGSFVIAGTVTPFTPPALVLTHSGISTDVAEGGATDTYTVSLSVAPTASVTVTLNPGAQVNVTPSTLTFTTANWNSAQSVTVTAVDDSAVEGVHIATINHTTSSTDVNYSGKTSALTVNITDNDFAPGIRITETAGSTNVTEGGATDTYMVSLFTVPTANVTVTLSPSSQVTIAPKTLVFTPANWNVPQSVTVTAVDDALIEGLHTGVVAHTSASSDANYSGKTASLTVSITDNEVPPKGVTITETGGSTNVVEGGSTDTYRVVLRSMPTASVTITISAGTQLTTTPSTLTFTPGNWNSSQTVTVAAVNDTILEGTHSYFISHTSASTDTDYNAIGITTVVVVISDDDTPVPLRVFRPLRYSRDRSTANEYEGQVTISNLSTAAGTGPLYAVLRNLPDDVVALNLAGTTAKGSPYYRLPGTGNLPASTTLRVPIRLQNNSNQPMGTYLQGFTIEITGIIDDAGAADPSGYVYVDANKNGHRDLGEVGIPDVLIELTGVTADGQQVFDSMRTDANGYYNFIVLPGTYAVRQAQPAGYRDGPESLGTLGGIIGDDLFTNIVVRPGDNGTDYDFGEWINHAPVLHTEDFTAHARDLAFSLLATDQEVDDPLTYTVHLADRSDLAYELKHELGLLPAKKYATGKLKLGLGEIWLKGAGKQKYLLLPNGELYQFVTKRGALETQNLLAVLSPAFYADPNLLTAAAVPIVTFDVVDNHVTLRPRAGFAGIVDITASVHDGVAGTASNFRVTLTNAAPTLGEIANVQVSAGNSVVIGLQANDTDGDLLAWAVQLTGGERLAYELKLQLGLRPTTNYSVDWMGYGYQEKWLTGSNKQKYFLLPTGELYRYAGRRGPLGNHTLVDNLDSDFYVDPSLLWGASQPTVGLEIFDNQLRITPRVGYHGTFTIAVHVSDGIDLAVRSFSVTVPN